ncbi:MAG TPA: hypothetical protein VIK33_06645 [Anaerolineae bacterium]
MALSACSPAPVAPTPALTLPLPTRPPTWTPTVAATATSQATPIATRTLTPPVTPDTMQVVVAENNAFSIQIPANWKVTQSTRRVEGSSVYEVKYFAAVGPGDPPQPGVIIFYEWPSSLEVTNDNAWESAFALTTLVIKSCAVQLGQEKLPVDFGSEPAFGVEYVDSCGAAGLMTGAVHNGVNYGALFEAPAPYFGDWFPTLHDILVSITFGR